MILLWISAINRHFRLGEPLGATVRRRWHDLLVFRVAMEAEQAVVDKLRETSD